MGQAKRIALPDKENLPPKLQNLPPGYSIQEVDPSFVPQPSFSMQTDPTQMTPTWKHL